MSRVLWLVVSGLLIAVVAGGSSQTADARGSGHHHHHRRSMVGNGQMGGQMMNQGMANGGKRAQMAIAKKKGLAKK